MTSYNKQTLSKQARELGFVRDAFEKVCRLSEILKFISDDPLLSIRLALKGGTAINLTIFNLPRLSVDIDLDYSHNNSREEMLEERAQITNIIKRYMAVSGYELSGKSRFYHSLDSFIFVYTNAAGIRDNIKIEINYSLRCHVLPATQRAIETLGIFSQAQILSLAPVEIFGSKIVALLSRTAARDLYDLNNMVYFGLFDESQQEILRKCVVFYTAIGNENISDRFDIGRVDSLTHYRIKTDLLPVIRKKDTFDLPSAQKRVKDYLTELLVLPVNEKQFLIDFREKTYHPELLFDSDLLENIRNHPMVLWKMKV